MKYVVIVDGIRHGIFEYKKDAQWFIDTYVSPEKNAVIIEV